MSGVAYAAGLHRLTENTFAYLQPDGSWGRSNCGLVVGGADGLLVDTQFSLELTRRLLADISAVVPDVRIGTVVNTHANGDHCWGNELLTDAEIIGSEHTAVGMAHEVPPEAMTALASGLPVDDPLGRYMRRFFGPFDFTGITVTPPTRTFNGELALSIGAVPVQLVEVGPAHTDGDVIVHVPGDGVVFAGDILFIGDHPIMWTGPIENWIAACSRILDMGAPTIVPGHGPVTSASGVALFRSYLEHVASEGGARHGKGMPYWEAALDIPMDGFAEWGHRERLVITLASLYRQLGTSDAHDVLTVMRRTAEAYEALAGSAGH